MVQLKSSKGSRVGGYDLGKDALLSSLTKHGLSDAMTLLNRETHNISFTLGDQWSYEEMQINNKRGRESTVYGNEVDPTLTILRGVYLDKMGEPTLSLSHPSFSLFPDSVIGDKGYQEEAPAQGNDDSPAQLGVDQINSILHDFFANKGGHDVFARAFEYSFYSGISLVFLDVDYTFDSSEGDLKADLVRTGDYVIDPDTTKRDLSDCDYVITKKVISRNIAENLYRKKRGDYSNCSPFSERYTGWSSTGTLVGRNVNIKHSTPGYWENRVEESTLYKRVVVSINHTYDMDSDIYTPIFSDSELELAEASNLPIEKREIEVIEKTVFINGCEVTLSEDNGSWRKYSIYYPFVIVAPKWIEAARSLASRAVSIVGLLEGPQKEKNLLQVQIAAMRETPLNTGFLISGNAVPRDTMETGVKSVQKGSCSLLFLDGVPEKDVRRIDPPSVGMGYFEGLGLDNIPKAIGLNSAQLGEVQSGNESAMMLQLRREASLSSVYGLVREVYRSIEAFTKVFLFQLRFWSTYKWKRSLGGEDPSSIITNFREDFVYGSFYTGAMPKISVEEIPYSPSQRHLFVAQITELLSFLSTLPPGFGYQSELFDLMLSNVPLVGKNSVIKVMKNLSKQKADEESRKMQMESEIASEELRRKNEMSDLLIRKELREIEMLEAKIAVEKEKARLTRAEVTEKSSRTRKTMLESDKIIGEIVDEQDPVTLNKSEDLKYRLYDEILDDVNSVEDGSYNGRENKVEQDSRDFVNDSETELPSTGDLPFNLYELNSRSNSYSR